MIFFCPSHLSSLTRPCQYASFRPLLNLLVVSAKDSRAVNPVPFSSLPHTPHNPSFTREKKKASKRHLGVLASLNLDPPIAPQRQCLSSSLLIAVSHSPSTITAFSLVSHLHPSFGQFHSSSPPSSRVEPFLNGLLNHVIHLACRMHKIMSCFFQITGTKKKKNMHCKSLQHTSKAPLPHPSTLYIRTFTHSLTLPHTHTHTHTHTNTRKPARHTVQQNNLLSRISSHPSNPSITSSSVY